MKRIGIIGSGFCGLMTAVHLIRKSDEAMEILLFNPLKSVKGIAYDPYSRKKLLNVIVSKMSAFPDKPNDFLDWVMTVAEYKALDRTLVANAFLSRYFYGEYLENIWKENLAVADQKGISVKSIYHPVTDLDLPGSGVELVYDAGKRVAVDKCVIATGNSIPGNPAIKNTSFFESKNYFRNPWDARSVEGIKSQLPVLIIGNGLTMADTVLGLLEKRYVNEIYSVSPNGFNILPHKHIGLRYTKFEEELPGRSSLYGLVNLVNKHIKILNKLGVTPEPVIDSLRPYSQKIWRMLSEEEKRLFMTRLRHLWGVARHRIPQQINEVIMNLRLQKKLHICSGKLIDITEEGDRITVTYLDYKGRTEKTIDVSRVINCTGPETDISKMDGTILKNIFLKGIVSQDKLKLGLRTDILTFQVIDKNGKLQPDIFTLGSNLRGELWESTAVNELRSQAERLAGILVSKTQWSGAGQ